MSRLIREKVLEAIQSDLRTDEDTKEKDKCVMCSACHDLDDLCPIPNS